MRRRDFFRTAGVAVGAGLLGENAGATAVRTKSNKNGYGMLIDTTLCVGCRTCEDACAEANGLPELDTADGSAFDNPRTPSETQWSVIDRRKDARGEDVFVKRQCMHCLEPACASACLTQAMAKTREGPVVWRGDKCMGCRYCMVSCPFDVPRFEYYSSNPRIQKCRMCWDRVAQGGVPACVENCPENAVIFGKREEMLEVAHKRIADKPDQYVHHIYGEHEAGGTSVLYLSAVPFERLGFRTDLGERSYPERTKEFLYAVPVVLTLWPGFLLALRRATDNETSPEEEK